MTRFPEAVLLVLVGATLGPSGLGVLSEQVLGVLDPAVPVALVAIGALVGLTSSAQGRRERRLLAAATTEAAVTMAVVAGGVLLIAPGWSGGAAAQGPGEAAVPLGLVALALGACAAPSAAAFRRPPAERVIAERIGDLDALLPIVIGGIVLANLRAPSTSAAVLLALQASGVALVIVAAAWLLISRAVSDTEQRVFTVALLLLLAGAADYLSLSALLSGLIAGLFLERAGGAAREAIGRDVMLLERPLVALVLLVTGARVDLPLPWAGFGLTFLLIRTVAKLIAGWTAGRLAGEAAPRDLGMALLSPGIVGIAFALNAERAMGSGGGIVLAVATVGVVGSELLAMLVRPRESAA